MPGLDDRDEIVLVDDASSDATPVLAGWPQVRYERLTVPSGFARAVNHGVAAATGETIVLLNNDTVQARNAADGANAAGALAVYEGAAMDLALVNTSSTARFTATEAITDSGTLTVSGATSFKTLKDGGAAITLDETASTFGRRWAAS